MASDKVEVVGLRELTRRLKLIDEALPAEVKALDRAGAERVASVARGRVTIQSGALLSTIGVDATERGASVQAGSTLVPYAGVQNFGWPARNIPAQHFLDGSLGDEEPAIVRDYEAGVAGLIRRVGL